MIIQLQNQISANEKNAILEHIALIGYKTSEVQTQKGYYLVCIGKNEFDIRMIGNLPGVQDVHRVSDPYKLVSRKWKVGESTIDLGDGIRIGGGDFSVMAGPCSIESEEQIQGIVDHLVKNNI